MTCQCVVRGINRKQLTAEEHLLLCPSISSWTQQRPVAHIVSPDVHCDTLLAPSTLWQHNRASILCCHWNRHPHHFGSCSTAYAQDWCSSSSWRLFRQRPSEMPMVAGTNPYQYILDKMETRLLLYAAGGLPGELKMMYRCRQLHVARNDWPTTVITSTFQSTLKWCCGHQYQSSAPCSKCYLAPPCGSLWY